MEIRNNLLIRSKMAVRLCDIVLLTADINYTFAHLSNGRKMIFAITLKELERRLANSGIFFRTHKSYLINLSYIQDCETSGDEMLVHLKYNHCATVSRRKKAAFVKLLSYL